MSNPIKEHEPLWRDEFAVSKADERYVSRRQLAKFLTLASIGMFAGNLWILIKSWLRKATDLPAHTGCASRRDSCGKREIVPVSRARRTMHHDSDRPGLLGRLQSKVHAPFVRRLSTPARMIGWSARVTRVIFR